MKMKQETKQQITESIQNFRLPRYREIPNVGLYLDQATKYVAEYLAPLGEYTLTQEDLLALSRFEDGIATANYDIDIHSPDGSGTSHHYFKAGEWYEIPYRCLIPKKTKNLLVAGRCISATHEAQASFRVMPFCSALGQAAGAAIALSVKDNTDIRSIDVQKLRSKLRNEGFVI